MYIVPCVGYDYLLMYMYVCVCYSLSECYFAGKGTALVLPPHERLRPSRRSSAAGSDIQQHLQSMFYLLRQEETLKMVSKYISIPPPLYIHTHYTVYIYTTYGPHCLQHCLVKSNSAATLHICNFYCTTTSPVNCRENAWQFLTSFNRTTLILKIMGIALKFVHQIL